MKLKPCPFCGGAASIYKLKIMCANPRCAVLVVTTPHIHLEDSIKVWNIRKQSKNVKQVRKYSRHSPMDAS